MKRELLKTVLYLKENQKRRTWNCSKQKLRSHFELNNHELDNRTRALSKEGLLRILLLFDGIPSLKSFN